MPSRSLAHVALGFVALTAVALLTVVLRVGVRVEREVAEFGATQPGPTQLAFDSRVGLSLFVGVVVIAAVAVHRHSRAVLFLVLLGLLQFAIAGAYLAALWLPYRPPW